MPDELYHRQLDILSPQDIEEEIGLIGVGGIGSPTALVLGKMGVPKITYWDFDKVEMSNLPNQLFRKRDINNYKVGALQDILKDFGIVEYVPIPKKWDRTILPITISAVDSMETRKEIWEAIKKKNHKCNLYIDARMGGELMKIYALKPYDPIHIVFYEKTLYSSNESTEIPCTARAIFYNCFVIAGLIGCLIKKHIKGEEMPKEIVFDLKTLTFLKN